MKNRSEIVILIFIIMITILSFLMYIIIRNMYTFSYIKVGNSDIVYYKNSNPINIENIVSENTSVKKSEKLVVEEIDLEYETLYKENSNLPSGFFRVLQLGEIGKQTVILKQCFENEELINEEIVANNIIQNSVEKIIEVGTGSGYLKSQIYVGDNVYVSANNLKLKEENNLQSKTINLLKSNDELNVLEIQENWYYVKYNDVLGYVLKEGVSTYNSNKKIDQNLIDNNVYTKSELLNRLSFGMDLSVQSDLSLEQFEKIFENQTNDIYGIFRDNAKYFYYAEEQYNINGIFLASIAIHESAWGTSSIARNKKNLFGYAAYDKDPYNSASNFSTYAEGIDLVARVLMKNYLNSSGTQLPDGSIASGKYFSGKTVSDVNKRYATDKNWANCVYKWMETLYNSIP